MENLRFWDAVKHPPESALKAIGGGRMKGKTDISPQWRLRIMTETFGPVGVGWKYEIIRFWTETGAFDEVMAFAQVNMYYKDDDKWSDPVPGIGGSMLVEKESKGLHNSDEAFKMALTDALSVSMKAVGVAADIYMGMTRGSKYTEQKQDPPKKQDNKKAEPPKDIEDPYNSPLPDSEKEYYLKHPDLDEKSKAYIISHNFTQKIKDRADLKIAGAADGQEVLY